MPGRDDGKMLRTTHPQFIPGTNQLIICTNDIENHSKVGLCFIQLMALLKGMRVINFNKFLKSVWNKLFCINKGSSTKVE